MGTSELERSSLRPEVRPREHGEVRSRRVPEDVPRTAGIASHAGAHHARVVVVAPWNACCTVHFCIRLTRLRKNICEMIAVQGIACAKNGVRHSFTVFLRE